MRTAGPAANALGQGPEDEAQAVGLEIRWIRRTVHYEHIDSRDNSVSNMASTNVRKLCGAHAYCNLKQQHAVVQQYIP